MEANGVINKIDKKAKEFNFSKFATIAFWILFFVQVITLAYINLTQMRYHLGYDASSSYLKAIEMARQGTVFIDNWVHTTVLSLDSPVPLAAVIYSITGNIFFSYGLANLIIDMLIFSVLFSIMQSLKTSNMSKAIVLNIVACTYLSPEFSNLNDLGYVSCFLTSLGAYSVKILIILMVIKMSIDVWNHKINYLFIIMTEALLFISGLSSGWYILVTIIVPALLYCAIDMFLNNSIKHFLNLNTLLLGIGALLVAIGKRIATNYIGFSSLDGGMHLVRLNELIDNAASVFVGFIEILGGLASNITVYVLSKNGIICMLALVICIVCLISFLYVMVLVKRNIYEERDYEIILSVVIVNILMYCVLYTSYTSSAQIEARYLIPLFVCMTLFVGRFIDSLSDGLVFKKFGVLMVFFCLLGLNVYNNKVYVNTKTNYDILNKIAEKADELEVPVVYFDNDSQNVNDCDCRNMRVIDSGRVYKSFDFDEPSIINHWGDYTYFDEVYEVQGTNMLVAKEERFEVLPEYIKNLYEVYDTVGDYTIYYADENRFDFKSGVTEDKNLDFPTSPGMVYANGELNEEGYLVSDGTEGYLLYGPNTSIEAGKYDFVINYEIIESGGNTAKFEISLDSGTNIVCDMNLDKSNTTAAFSDVVISEDSQGLEYRVYNYAGTIIKILSVEIYRKE
ncbi:MAG: hypothetical protein LIO99_13640 [Clostridiales bacterium]|nr:hypothetical protein [Clostridiales bacterium]MCC8107019.1 hypothetical protein [Clostridiales bacterium]